MNALRFIARRLGAHIPETPAPSSPASGQVGGGVSPSASAGRKNALPDADLGACVPPHHASGGAPYWPSEDEWRAHLRARIDGRMKR